MVEYRRNSNLLMEQLTLWEPNRELRSRTEVNTSVAVLEWFERKDHSYIETIPTCAPKQQLQPVNPHGDSQSVLTLSMRTP